MANGVNKKPVIITGNISTQHHFATVVCDKPGIILGCHDKVDLVPRAVEAGENRVRIFPRVLPCSVDEGEVIGVIMAAGPFGKGVKITGRDGDEEGGEE